jgi:hypothetical protein
MDFNTHQLHLLISAGREKVVVARMARDGELRRLFQEQSENILKTSFCVVEHTKIILKQKEEVRSKFK